LESGVPGANDGESEEETKERRVRGERLREVLFGYVTRDLQAR